MSEPFPACCTPVIETGRLRLRSHRPEDFVNCARMWADPVVTRYIGGKPLTKEEVWARVLRYVGHWSWLGFGYWVVEEKTSGRFLGEVGFADYKREIELATDGVPEIGWVLDPVGHGQGYATESVRAAINWGDGRFGSIQTICLIAPDNSASIRVATKCGYKEILQTVYKGENTIIFARDGLR